MTTSKASTPSGTKYFSPWQMFPMKTLDNVQHAAQLQREIENSRGTVAGHSAEGTRMSMSAMRTGLFKEQQPGKLTQEEFQKAVHRKWSRIANMETVIVGPRRDLDEEIRAASSTMWTRKREQRKEDPVLSPWRENTRKETDKEISKRQDPKVPVRQESHTNRSELGVRRSNVRRTPHAIVGTHQNAHTANQKVDANGETRVYSSTQAKQVKKTW